MFGLGQRKVMRDRGAMRDMGRYGSIGIEFFLNMAVGFWIGRWLDGKFGTKWIVWLGSLVGVYSAFRSLFVAAKRMTADAKRLDRLEAEARKKAIEDDDVRAHLKRLDAMPDPEEEEPK